MAKQNNIAEIKPLPSIDFMSKLEEEDFLLSEVVNIWKGVIGEDEKTRLSSLGFLSGIYISNVSEPKNNDFRDELLMLYLVAELVRP